MTQAIRTALMEALLSEAPCTCPNPDPGDWPHDPENPNCYLSRVRAALASISTPALETAVHETPAQPEKDPSCQPPLR
jgi:hypothetical protein